MNELQGVVYMLANKYNNVLYTGVTSNLQRRLAEHKLHINQGFSAKYNTDKLVYYELFDRLDLAIQREKQLKNWKREWKDKLINDINPEWKDLSEDIGCDVEYIHAVKEAYDIGQYFPGDSGLLPPHSSLNVPHSGPDPESPLMRQKKKRCVSEDAFKTEFD